MRWKSRSGVAVLTACSASSMARPSAPEYAVASASQPSAEEAMARSPRRIRPVTAGSSWSLADLSTTDSGAIVRVYDRIG
ncbi:hypothetical protein ACQP2U_02025 [Nocardia sp. CA-084685]|uniref:hypothetical protein n=1 Tax=Nocardia sp. CA-084685 TaxID=3239970 RepID=UPI003D955F43